MPASYKGNPTSYRLRFTALVGKACVAALVMVALTFVSLADRLHLSDGTTLEVDEAWEDAQGVWFRRGNVRQLLDRTRVRSIERGRSGAEASSEADKPNAAEKEAVAAKTTVPQSTWIYLTGGARLEVDEATEKADGVWYRRGALSIFLERPRIERIERGGGALAAGAATASVGRAWRERGWSTGNNRIDGIIRESGVRHGVDPFLIFCVMEQESRFHLRAVSYKGARGLMQLMPGTARRFGVRRVYDPAENIRGGTRYLKELLGMFGGRVDLALASYNAGEGAVVRYGGKVPPYRETRHYVQRISRRYGRSKGTEGTAASTVPPPRPR